MVDISKYYLMKYANDRATNVLIKGSKYTFVKGVLFGVLEKNKKVDSIYVFDKDLSFDLEISKSEQLMNRSKEYKGKLPKVEKKEVVKKPVKQIPVQNDRESTYKTILKKAGLTLDTITKARLEKLLKTFQPAMAQAFRDWVVSKTGKSIFKTIQPKVNPKMSVVKVVKPAPTITKISPTSSGKLKIKVSEVDFPEIDDMFDTDIPESILRYRKISVSKSKELPCNLENTQKTEEQG